VTWERYAQTIIAVETVDGWLDLNGPQAVEKLPWAGPLHVITAWNPGGLRSQDENQKWQTALENELWATGHKLHRAFGRSTTTTHQEDSVAVEGLDRAEAIQIGARYEQDAIFEVTDDEVFVLACHESRLTAIPRLP
jgi:Protein of unknown function (DUF3293)